MFGTNPALGFLRSSCRSKIHSILITQRKVLPGRYFVSEAPRESFVSQFFGKKTDYNKSDGVSSDYKLVYQAPMKYYAIGMQYTIAGCSGLWTLLVGYFVSMERDPWPETISHIIETQNQGVVYLTSFACCLMLMRMVLQRYALRIYYRPSDSKFTATILRFMPGFVQQVEFQAGEMKIVKPYFGLRERVLQDSHVVRGQRLIIYERFFKNPKYYNLMLGYQ